MQKLNIEFISTPYTLEDAKFLSELKLKIITASADIVDHKLHQYYPQKANIIISTGMASIKEDETLKIYKRNKKECYFITLCF